MKSILKKILPRPVMNWARRHLKQYMPLAHRPKSIHYHGDRPDVLACFVAYNKYGGYCVPQSSHHRPAAQMILRGQVWEADTIAFVRDHAGEGDIVHAGTYFGDFIPGLSTGCADGARVWAFEPNPENYRCARITLAINNLKNVELHNAGLGASRDTIRMKVRQAGGEALGGGSQLMAEGDTSDEQLFVDVDILALDDVVPPDRQVSVIQLDVEEFEQQALTGAMQTIQRCRPIILLENLPDENWLAEHILSMGYQMAGDVHGNKILRPSSA